MVYIPEGGVEGYDDEYCSLTFSKYCMKQHILASAEPFCLSAIWVQMEQTY